jgi:hypothetical protein
MWPLRVYGHSPAFRRAHDAWCRAIGKSCNAGRATVAGNAVGAHTRISAKFENFFSHVRAGRGRRARVQPDARGRRLHRQAVNSVISWYTHGLLLWITCCVDGSPKAHHKLGWRIQIPVIWLWS